VQKVLIKISENVAKVKEIGKKIGIPGDAQSASGTQANQSAQPLPPSQSNQAPIHQIQQIIQTSSTDFQRHLSEFDSLESKLQISYDDGAFIDTIRNNIVNNMNSALSDLDQCDQKIQNSLISVQQAQQNNQQQAQQAWAQVRAMQTADVLHCEGQINLMSDAIFRIDSDISSITRNLLNFSPSLTAVSNSFNVFKANFAQKSTDFSNLNQQMQLPALSQTDSQQLLKAQQDMKLLVNSENVESQKMQNLFSNYQIMQANLAAHIRNRDDLRQAHKVLVARVQKIKDDLINNP
jgi:rubrerythrin